jgi:hypothetical protein
MKWKLSCRANSKSFPTHSKQKPLAGHCPALPELAPRFKIPQQKPLVRLYLAQSNIVRLPQTLFGFWIWAPRQDSWESPINTPPPPMTLHAWLLNFSIEHAHTLHSKRSNSLPPRASIPSSYLGIAWSKGSSSLCDSPLQACLGYWIFVIHTYYSWSVAPRWLEVALEPPLVWSA